MDEGGGAAELEISAVFGTATTAEVDDSAEFCAVGVFFAHGILTFGSVPSRNRWRLARCL